jgi:two-component system nitrate/nitrite response regulator NarL
MSRGTVAVLRANTAIVAEHLLARAGLHSLLEKYVYRVIGAAETVTDLLHLPLSGGPKLILIAVDGLDALTNQASACRQHWPESRIVAIYDCSDAVEQERVFGSKVDGCVSTYTSERALLGLLDLLVGDDSDLFFMLQLRSDAIDQINAVQPAPPVALASGPQTNDHLARNCVDGHHSSGHKDVSSEHNVATYVRQEDVSVIPADPKPHRNVPKLSERELQVLDGIVHGLQNKMIARTYGITEATVKVHMKSILRKIQVQNRTQAAIWAMGQNTPVCSTLEQRLFASDKSFQED